MRYLCLVALTFVAGCYKYINTPPPMPIHQNAEMEMMRAKKTVLFPLVAKVDGIPKADRDRVTEEVMAFIREEAPCLSEPIVTDTQYSYVILSTLGVDSDVIMDVNVFFECDLAEDTLTENLRHAYKHRKIEVDFPLTGSSAS